MGSTEALIWGGGNKGVVLAHGAAYDAASWTPQAQKIADSGAVVAALEDTSAQSVEAAAKYLRDQRGAKSVTLVGASAGASGVLEAGQKSGVADQMILLSGTGQVSGLGDYPKLFVASENEGLASEVRQMAKDAPGKTKALILPGSAHAQAIFKTDQGDKLLNTITQRVRKNG